jgi:putative membrane protein
MKRMGILPFVCAAALVVGCNSNNNKTSENRNEPAAVGTAGEADRTAVHNSEKDFITKQLADGDAEVELGRMAAQKAVNPEVKRFAQMMVDDHTKAGGELKQVAAKYNVDTTDQSKDLDKHKDAMDRLSKLSGSQFDKEYMKAMVDDHQNAVDSLESRVDSTASLKDKITDKDAKDTQVVPENTDNAVAAAVNQWAAQSLPVVRHHLDEAKMINDKLDRNGRVTDTARNTTSRNSKARK